MKQLIIIFVCLILGISFAKENIIIKKIKKIDEAHNIIITEDGKNYNFKKIESHWLSEIPNIIEIHEKDNGEISFILLKRGEKK